MTFRSPITHHDLARRTLILPLTLLALCGAARPTPPARRAYGKPGTIPRVKRLKRPQPARKPYRAIAQNRPAPLEQPESGAGQIQLWTRGRFRGANVTLDASPSDLNDLTTWGANAVRITLGSETVETEAPYGFKETGLQRLDSVLETAWKAGLKVIVAFKAAPGRSSVSDERIWKLPECHAALAEDWKAFALRYKSSTTLVGYDLLSEPNPEILLKGKLRPEDLIGTTGDWNLLAKRLTDAVRESDPERPLIVEAPSWAYASGFERLKPTGDSKTVYSFHMFSPHLYTHQKPGEPLSFPGPVPAYVEPAANWNEEAIRDTLQPAVDFQRANNVPLLVGEFGVERFAPGAAAYLRSLLVPFEEAKWHWTFWGFRDSPDWNPEFGPDPGALARLTPTDAPLMRLYRDFLSLNDHPTYLQDLPLLKKTDWVKPMKAVHKKFAGTQGTVGLFGDSITYGRQFFGPLFEPGYTADPKTLADLQRFGELVPTFVADWKTAEHGNQSGWRIAKALPDLPQVIARDNPEVALIMFGTNDLNNGTPEEVGFQDNLEQLIGLVTANGTVPILSTLPPKHGKQRSVWAYNQVIKRCAIRHNLPLIDFYGAIVRRRKENWYRTLIMGDGIHPTFPEEFQKDMTERGLSESGFTLRNYLALEAVLAVLDRIRD